MEVSRHSQDLPGFASRNRHSGLALTDMHALSSCMLDLSMVIDGHSYQLKQMGLPIDDKSLAVKCLKKRGMDRQGKK
jgi:hypothetical protein